MQFSNVCYHHFLKIEQLALASLLQNVPLAMTTVSAVFVCKSIISLTSCLTHSCLIISVFHSCFLWVFFRLTNNRKVKFVGLV